MPAQAPTQAPELKQIAFGLKRIIDSVYRDGIDALMQVEMSDGGTIAGKFRDGLELYDFTITASGKLSYVETETDRRDSYLAGFYLSDRVSSSASKAYVQGMLSQKLRLDRSKSRQCKNGKPCGATCITKGYQCSVTLGLQQKRALSGVRGAIAKAKQDGTWKKALIAGGVLAGAALLGVGAVAIASQSGKGGGGGAAPAPVPQPEVTQPETPAAQAKSNSETQADPGASGTAQLEAGRERRTNQTQSVENGTIVTGNPIYGLPPGRDRRTNQVTAENNSTLVTPSPRVPPALPVVASRRQATPEEQDAINQRRTNQTPRIRNRVIVPAPPSANSLEEAVQLDEFTPESQQLFRGVLRSIDKVVKVPGLTEVKLDVMREEELKIAPNADGIYRWQRYLEKETGKVSDIVPRKIAINQRQLDRTGTSPYIPGPELALVHEIGHMIDHVGIGDRKDGLASDAQHPAMKEFFDTVSQTRSIGRLSRVLRTTRNAETKGFIEYSLRPREVFARAFGQYVAQKSGSGVLKAMVKETRNAKYAIAWDDRDFKAVEAAMDKMFKELGMR